MIEPIVAKLRQGMNREEVVSAIGEPEDKGGTSRKYKTPSVYKYGDLQLWFEPWKSGKLFAIWRESIHRYVPFDNPVDNAEDGSIL